MLVDSHFYITYLMIMWVHSQGHVTLFKLYGHFRFLELMILGTSVN